MGRLLRRFKRWMEYNPPSALSSKGWRLFKNEFKRNAPVRFWIRYPLRFSVILPIRRRYQGVTDWIRYRTYNKYHLVKTALRPGYYDAGTRILYASFALLKDYVELDLGRTAYAFSDERSEPSFAERYFPFYWHFTPFDGRYWGLKHLNWAATLDDPSLPAMERCDHQAISAREVRELYLWWEDIRPIRKEIPLPSYSDQKLGSLSCLDDDFDDTADDYKIFHDVMEENSKLLDKWKIEDTEMLIRLVKIRESLWT